MAWKSWDVYVVKDGETVHRGVTGGATRQSARELASTLFNIPKDKLMLVPKGSAGRSKARRAQTATENRRALEISNRRLDALKANGEDVRNTAAWRDAVHEYNQINRAIAFSNFKAKHSK